MGYKVYINIEQTPIIYQTKTAIIPVEMINFTFAFVLFRFFFLLLRFGFLAPPFSGNRSIKTKSHRLFYTRENRRKVDFSLEINLNRMINVLVFSSRCASISNSSTFFVSMNS